MKILQLTHDWKWTGPAEPMLQLALALRERGHTLELACPEPPADANRSLAEEARAAGLAPSLTLSRDGGFWRDVRRLRGVLRRGGFDLAHAWHTRDHLLLRAALVGPSPRPAVVRSWRRAEAVPAAAWNRWLFGPGCDGLLCVSPGTARRNTPIRGGRPIAGSFGAVDVARFTPAPPAAGVRESLGLKPDHRVVGIVARVQAQRRFDLLLAAAKRLCAADPAARLLVVGRGTRREELAVEPARRMGLAERVLFAGYRTGDYADVLRSMDVFTYLVPGSDGTCRALLEAAACGIPAVTSRRGALSEIVVHDETGLVVDEDPGSLSRAWRRLLHDAAERRRLGEAAARRARTLFRPETFADAAEALYAACLSAHA